MERETNTCAIVGFILSFFCGIAGLIVSIVALKQIKKTHEKGKGLAVAGVVLSSISVAFVAILLFIVSFMYGFFVSMIGVIDSTIDDMELEQSMEDRVCSYGDYYYTGRYGQDGYISCGPTSYSGYYVCEYVDEYGDLEEVTCRNYEY